MKALHLWFVFLLIKLGLASWLPYSPDESYYWVWSQKLALSYFDHPPMIAWVLKLNELLALPPYMDRLVLVLIGQACVLVWLMVFDLLKFDQTKKILFLLLLQLHPMTGWGNILATPDTPLHLFIALSFLTYLRTLKSQSLIDYSVFGLSLGLGFCSKYQIVLLLPPLIFVALWFHRKQLRPLGLLCTILVGLLTCAPVLAWNFMNEMISFKFQIAHGLGAESWEPQWTLKYLAGQLVLVSPFALALIASLWKKKLWQEKRDRDFLISLLAVSTFTLLFFLYSSFKGAVEANWPSLAYPFIFLLAAHFWSSKKLLYHSLFWGVLFAALFSFLTFTERKKWAEKAYEPFIMRDVAAEIAEFKPLYAGSYQLASALWHQYRTPIYKVPGMSRFDMYDMWQESLPQENKFYVLKYANTDWPESFADEKLKVKLSRTFPLELELYEVVRD